MSQNKTVLKYLQSGKTLTPKQAISFWDVMRLASRIKDLKEIGHVIETTMVKRNKKRFAQYRLAN